MKQKSAFGKPEDCTEVLLHACCAPCSSAIVEWLLAHDVQPTIYYYNPNIWPREEYDIRKDESKRHAESLGIRWIDGDYDHERRGCTMSADWSSEPERGRRCEQCFTLRLTAAARKARNSAFPSLPPPWPPAAGRASSKSTVPVLLPEKETVRRRSLRFWAQNWRKGGLQERRNQLLKEYGFYNQQYCGCEFSIRQG